MICKKFCSCVCIYIVKNKLYIEDVKKKEALNAVMVSTNIKCEFIGNNKKRKREENNENNIELNEEENEEKKLIICTCSKSGCNKNYCECFKAKVKCNNKCRCIKCLNKQEDKNKLEEPKMIMRSKSTPINIPNNNNLEYNNINTNIENIFTVHRISVVINIAQTLINTEKLDSLETYKFLNKKRNIS